MNIPTDAQAYLKESSAKLIAGAGFTPKSEEDLAKFLDKNFALIVRTASKAQQKTLIAACDDPEKKVLNVVARRVWSRHNRPPKSTNPK